MKKLLEKNSSLAKTLGFKILIICIIALLLLIPTGLIKNIISDRQNYQRHLNFNLSYFVSMIMVVVLTSMYVGSITKTLKLSLIIAGVEFVIYIFLFGILQLTDYALLVGTIGLFVALAAAMYFTRNINAYMKDSQ